MKKGKKILFLLTVFTTIFSVRNVNAAPTIIADKMKENITTTGEGLYLESYSNNYYFKGEDPNNYIRFNGQLWRVMTVNSDGTVKIMKAKAIDGVAYDVPFLNRESSYNAPSLADTRYSSVSTDYCYSDFYWYGHYYGCKIWGSRTSLFDKDKNPITQLVHDKGDMRDLPTKESTLNTYLNGEYYNNLSTVNKDRIVESWFDVGPYVMNYGNITKDFAAVESVKWKGKIGIISITDYPRTSTNPECTNVLDFGTNYDCGSDPQSYIYGANNGQEFLFTLNPYNDKDFDDNHYALMEIGEDGDVGNWYPSYSSYGTIPVLTLRKDLLIVDGDGSENTPYELEKKFEVTTKVENGNGTISPGAILNDGESFEIIFAPYNGYTIDKVLLNGTDVTSSVVDNKLVINNVDSDKEIVVTFKKIESATNNNPATGDNVLGSIMLLLASITMIVETRVVSKKLNSN